MGIGPMIAPIDALPTSRPSAWLVPSQALDPRGLVRVEVEPLAHLINVGRLGIGLRTVRSNSSIIPEVKNIFQGMVPMLGLEELQNLEVVLLVVGRVIGLQIVEMVETRALG